MPIVANVIAPEALAHVQFRSAGGVLVGLEPGVAISENVWADFAFGHAVRRLSKHGSAVVRSELNP